MWQIEEHLVGIKGLMIGVETPGEIPPRQRLAVEGQLGPILIGILLRRGEATDLTFRERRERIEGEGLIAIVHPLTRFWPKKSASEYWRLIRWRSVPGIRSELSPSVVYALPPLVTADMFFPSHRP